MPIINAANKEGSPKQLRGRSLGTRLNRPPPVESSPYPNW